MHSAPRFLCPSCPPSSALRSLLPGSLPLPLILTLTLSVSVFLSPFHGMPRTKNPLQRISCPLFPYMEISVAARPSSCCERCACTSRRRSPFASIFGSESNKNRTTGRGERWGESWGEGEGEGGVDGGEFPSILKTALRPAGC